METLKIIHSRVIFVSRAVCVEGAVAEGGLMDDSKIISEANSKLIEKMLEQLEMLKPYVRTLEAYYYIHLSSLPLTEDATLCTVLYDHPNL